MPRVCHRYAPPKLPIDTSRWIRRPIRHSCSRGRFMKRFVPLAVAVLAVAACQDASGPAAHARPAAPSTVDAAKAVPIPGDYIITLHDNLTAVDGVARSLSGLHKGALKHLYKSALKGFAVQNISEAAAAAIAADPRVERVEADQVMTAIGTESPATGGIDRIDQNVMPLDNTYNYANDGSSVTVYIIDTGINFGHVDFGGRASTGVDEVTIGGNGRPASERAASTVGATAVNDAFAYFSNYGSCVDISAPGVSITSAWYRSSTATNTISGTSMATPHVTGAAALYLSAYPTATPTDVVAALTANATRDAISSVPAGTVNLLLYTGFIGSSAPPPPPPPPPAPSIASFTQSCFGLTCSFDASASTDATSYSWNFGDGTTASGVTTSHRFARNRSYTVSLTTQPTSSSSTASATITCSRRTCS